MTTDSLARVYEPHVEFRSPSDSTQKIWRYMDLAKMVALLNTQSLWFARADTLGDPHEGAYGAYNATMRSEVYAGAWATMLDELSELRRLTVRHTFINCWHMSEVESMAMWSLYSSAGQGVAVVSSFARLLQSLETDDSVFVGAVRYVDPSTEWIPEGTTFSPFVHKRRSYEHERELRAVIQKNPKRGDVLDLSAPSPAGLNVTVDVKQLIEEVLVSPGQPAWYMAAVDAVVKALAPGTPVRQSDLHADPIY